MRKPIGFIMAVILLLAACAPTAPATTAPTTAATTVSTVPSEPVTDTELIIFTWAEYIDPDILAEFEEETGIKIEMTYFNKNEEMLTSLEASKGANYDLILASDYIIEIAAKQGLVQDLDLEKITNFEDIDPTFQGHFYDPEDKYTVPFAAGTPLIVYDPSRVEVPIKGYADLWNPELLDSLVLFDDARLMVGFAMKSLGGSLNSTDPELIAEAGEKLIELKPNIRKLDYDTPHETMASGEAKVGFMFTPQVLRTLEVRPEFEVVYPEEGLGFGIDCFFIPSQAPHVDAAHIFLDYILQGEVSARLSAYTEYINCVSTAKEFVPEESLANQYLYIPAEVLGEAEFIQDIGSEATALIDDAWTRFKNAR